MCIEMGPFYDNFLPAGGSGERIQTVEVVVMAAMVPMGMDFWASRRSPERLEPAMIPAEIMIIITTRTPINNRRGSAEMKAVAASLRRAAVKGRRPSGDAHPSQRGNRCRPAA